MKKGIEWELILRCFEGDFSVEDEADLDDWLKADEENLAAFNHLKRIWEAPAAEYPKPDLEKALNLVKQRAGILNIDSNNGSENILKIESFVNEKPIRRNLFSLRFIQAAAVFLVMFSLFHLSQKWVSNGAMNEIYIENTKHQLVTLKDGTEITLDSGSRLKFADDFNEESREVFLEGEGYFDVTSNHQKPFIINTNGALITVLGTKFNISSWQQNNKVVLAVEQGRVSLRSKNKAGAEAEKILINNQVSIINENGYPSGPEFTEFASHLSWLKRVRYFENVPMQEVLFQLERWYDLEFILPDSSYKMKQVTIFVENKPIEHIIDILAVMNDFQYSFEGKRVTFWTTAQYSKDAEGS